MHSGVLQVARGGYRAKAPPLAARPEKQNHTFGAGRFKVATWTSLTAVAYFRRQPNALRSRAARHTFCSTCNAPGRDPHLCLDWACYPESIRSEWHQLQPIEAKCR